MFQTINIPSSISNFSVAIAILSLIARGLRPILHDPDKIHQLFGKKYQENRRKNNTGCNPLNGENRRKTTCIFPEYVSYKKMKLYYLVYVFTYFLCCAFTKRSK